MIITKDDIQYMSKYALKHLTHGNKDEADDLIQDVCVKLLKVEGASKTFMVRCLINQAKDEWRKNKVRSRYAYGFKHKSHTLPVEREIRFEPLIEDTLSRLRDDYREPLLLQIEGLTYKEIAAKLNLPLTTVVTRLGRGRRDFKLISGINTSKEYHDHYHSNYVCRVDPDT